MTWSTSQPRAGRPQNGNTQVRSRRTTCSRIRSGIVVARRGLLLVEVDDGLDGDLGAGVGAPGFQLVEQEKPLALLEPAGRTEDRGVAGQAGVEVGVEDDFARGGEVWSRYAGSFLTGYSTTSRVTCWSTTSRVVEVERGLRPREVTERLGPTCVERLLRTEGLLRGGAVGEGLVEVEAVGEVDLGLEPHGPGEVDVLVVDRDVARVDVEVAVLRVRGRVGLGEVVALDGLRDEPVELRGTDLPRHGGDLGVDETRPPPPSAPDSSGWSPRRRPGPARPAPVRRGPAPRVAAGGGAARGRDR